MVLLIPSLVLYLSLTSVCGTVVTKRRDGVDSVVPMDEQTRTELLRRVQDPTWFYSKCTVPKKNTATKVPCFIKDVAENDVVLLVSRNFAYKAESRSNQSRRVTDSNGNPILGLNGRPKQEKYQKILPALDIRKNFTEELNRLDYVAENGVRTGRYFDLAKAKKTSFLASQKNETRLFPVPCLIGEKSQKGRTGKQLLAEKLTSNPEKTVEFSDLSQEEHKSVCVGFLMEPFKPDSRDVELDGRIDDEIVSSEKMGQLLADVLLDMNNPVLLENTHQDFLTMKQLLDEGGGVKDLQGWLNKENGHFYVTDPGEKITPENAAVDGMETRERVEMYLKHINLVKEAYASRKADIYPTDFASSRQELRRRR